MHDSYLQNRFFWNLLSKVFGTIMLVIIHDSYFQTRFLKLAFNNFLNNDIGNYAWFIFWKSILLQCSFNTCSEEMILVVMHDSYFQNRFLWNLLLTHLKTMILVLMHDPYLKNRLFWNLLPTHVEKMILVIMHDSYFPNRLFRNCPLTHFETWYL